MEEIDPQPVGDESGEGDTHPLQNPVVLERIFELIPFEFQDFRNFRLVSRAWHTLSLSKWRQNAKLALVDKNLKQIDDRNDCVQLSRQLYLGLLENNQFQLGQHPFRKYSLKNWKINLHLVNHDGEQDQLHFWNRVGPLMTHLVLETCKFAGIEDLRIVIFQVTSNLQSLSLLRNEYTTERPARKAERLDPKLPQHGSVPPEQVRNNLEEFNIDVIVDADELSDYEDDGYGEETLVQIEYFPITWIEVFIHFPNIKKIGQLQLGYNSTEAEHLEFFESLEIIRNERGPRYLSDLQNLELLQKAFGPRLISTISRLHFPLKRLALCIDPAVDEGSIKQLMQYPLEFLNLHREVYFNDSEPRPFRNFPFGHQFSFLKKLTMQGLIAQNLMFLEECSNLEKFTYEPFHEDRFDAHLTQLLGDANPTRLEKLRDLRIDNMMCSAEQIRKLGELMPNVKSLFIGLDDGGFRAVCELWKGIDSLTIFPWYIGEEAFLGKDERSGKKFKKPNITHLTNLKWLSALNIHEEYGPQGFTEAMILDGILALPNLDSGFLCLFSEVSCDVRKQLEMKIPKCHMYGGQICQKPREKTHPLENPVVLERLFQLIPFELEEFRNYRLVSRAWNKFSLSTWRQNAWLTLHDFMPDPDEEVSGIPRQEYVEFMESGQYQLIQHPFRKYYLGGWQIYFQPTYRETKDQVDFWSRVGPLMTHLDIADCDFFRVADFRTVIFEATPNLQSLTLVDNFYDKRPFQMEQRMDPKLAQHALIPVEQVQNNLVELNIQLLSVEGETETDDEDGDNSEEEEPCVAYLPVTWMELFIHFPSIKKIGRLRLDSRNVDAELSEIFLTVEVLIKEHGPRYLAGLSELDFLVSDELIAQINRLQFPLKRLTLLVSPTVDREAFKKLLQYPLEYLNVERPGNRPFRHFPFGLQFTALKQLILKGPTAPNLMFLKKCPNLELFRYTPRVKSRLYSDLKQFLKGDIPTKLEKLNHLHIRSGGCGAAEIKMLAEIMPNVRNLIIGLDDGSFRAVCHVWKELKHLVINPFRVGEAALLGKNEKGGKEFHYPNVTDLKNLNYFGMQRIQRKPDRQGFTDAMILDGILALPNLTKVSLCLSSGVSCDARKQLKMRFPKSNISTQKGILKAGEKHPLENPTVLERLFQLIPFVLNEFKNFRLVSRAWNKFSLESWRQNAWLTLRDSQQDPNDDIHSREISGISRVKYLELIENEKYQLSQHPFRKYFLEGWNINLSTNKDQLSFWGTVGPLMTNLTLEKCRFSGAADLRTVIFQETPNLWRLSLNENIYKTERPTRKAERLDPKLPQHALIPSEQVRNKLVEFNIRLFKVNDYLPITWMELLAHFPNIKKIGNLSLGNEAELGEFFKSVRILRKEHGPHFLASLEYLNLWKENGGGYLGHRLVSCINRLRFPLKRLWIVINQTVGEKTFKELLQHPFESLCVVRWDDDYDVMKMKPFRNFPFGLKFLKLKTLFLWGRIATSLAFLKDCPNLERLLYRPFTKDVVDADLTQGLGDVNIPKLEGLKYLWIQNNNLCSAEQIRRLGELMPNVKHLEIGLHDEGFRVLCEVWSELENLRIVPFRVGERALLGEDEQSGEKYRHPNLTDLKNLNVFNTKYHEHQQGSFTDAMILDGLLALPNLENVEELFLSPQVSGHVRSLVEKKFPNCVIFTQDEDPTGGINRVVASAADSQRNSQNTCCTII